VRGFWPELETPSPTFSGEESLLCGFGLFWQTPGSEESSGARRHWETIEEIVLGEQLGFESAWLAESVFYPTRPMSNPLMVAIRRGATHRTHPLWHAGSAGAHSSSLSYGDAECHLRYLNAGRLDLCLGRTLGSRFGRFFGHGT